MVRWPSRSGRGNGFHSSLHTSAESGRAWRGAQGLAGLKQHRPKHPLLRAVLPSARRAAS
eukprot:1319170-Rhodomonas_salina.1